VQACHRKQTRELASSNQRLFQQRIDRRLWYAGYCCKAAYCTTQARCIVAKHNLHPHTKQNEQVERIRCSKPCRRSKNFIRPEQQRCIKVHGPGWCYSEYQEAGTIMASSTSDQMALPPLWSLPLLLQRRAPGLQPRSRCARQGNCLSVARQWKDSPPNTWPAAERCCDAGFMLAGSLRGNQASAAHAHLLATASISSQGSCLNSSAVISTASLLVLHLHVEAVP
jgi:hypothetical protein